MLLPSPSKCELCKALSALCHKHESHSNNQMQNEIRIKKITIDSNSECKRINFIYLSHYQCHIKTKSHTRIYNVFALLPASNPFTTANCSFRFVLRYFFTRFFGIYFGINGNYEWYIHFYHSLHYQYCLTSNCDKIRFDFHSTLRSTISFGLQATTINPFLRQFSILFHFTYFPVNRMRYITAIPLRHNLRTRCTFLPFSILNAMDHGTTYADTVYSTRSICSECVGALNSSICCNRITSLLNYIFPNHILCP